MPTIDIIIRNKTASAVNPPCIVCGNSDYNVKFDFDDEWQAHNNKIGVLHITVAENGKAKKSFLRAIPARCRRCMVCAACGSA